MRDGDVLIHVSRGMMNPDVDMTPSERTQLEQIHRIDATLDVLGEDASRKGRIVFLTEEGVSGELPEIVRAMGRKSQRAGVSNGFEALATHARVRGDKVFARSLAEHATRSEEKNPGGRGKPFQHDPQPLESLLVPPRSARRVVVSGVLGRPIGRRVGGRDGRPGAGSSPAGLRRTSKRRGVALPGVAPAVNSR
jgi:hypothetical protein